MSAKIYTLRREGRPAPLITVDPALVEVMRAKGWHVEEQEFSDRKASIVGAILWYSIITMGIIGCLLWFVSFATAAPCPVPVAGASVPAVSCERNAS